MTGFVRFGARDYDPVIGRWTARDPVLFNSGQINLYSYALNNPVNLIDPLGLQAAPLDISDTALIGGATFAGFLGGLVKGVLTTSPLDPIYGSKVAAMAQMNAAKTGGATAAACAWNNALGDPRKRNLDKLLTTGFLAISINVIPDQNGPVIRANQYIAEKIQELINFARTSRPEKK